jgi:exodeoxyribonuclease VII large subunit
MADQTAALSRRNRQAMTRLIERSRSRQDSLAKLLDALSYRKILERGFALVTSDGTPLRSAASVTPGAALDIEFHDGRVGATANDGKTAPRPRRPKAKGQQGTLF